MRQPLSSLASEWRRQGDLFSIRLPMFGELTYVADPEALREIFSGDPTRFNAGEGNAEPLGPLLGQNSLLTLDGEAHMAQRKLLLPPFHGERIGRYADTMRAAAERELASWPVGRPFPLRPAMQRVTLEVILRTVFGLTARDRIGAFERAIVRMAAVSNMILWAPWLRRDLGRASPWTRFLRARRTVDDLIYEEIRVRRADGDFESRDDVLSLLLQARHESGEPMSEVELRDELMTVVGAGHETTATALCWAFELLGRNPRVEARLREELASSGGGDEYLDAVMKETLRIRPVVVDVVRKLQRDEEIAGHLIPAGTWLVPAIAVVHQRPDLYPDPHEFRPERFLDGQPEPYTWIPFGGGVRRCIGASFAQMEIKVILRALLLGGRYRPASARPEVPRAKHVTVVPSRGARVVLEERLAPGRVTTPAPAVTTP
ncbi:MAG: cytochrome family [Thermoleophilaceae bacterium]|nr:cytochrome family [Thermoleophilaceae bacterium]